MVRGIRGLEKPWDDTHMVTTPIGIGLDYNDVGISCDKTACIEPVEVELSSFIARDIPIKYPIAVAGMNICGPEMCIEAAIEGAIGTLPRAYLDLKQRFGWGDELKQEIYNRNLRFIEEVKTHTGALVVTPITLEPFKMVKGERVKTTVADAEAALAKRGGISLVPVIDENGIVLGAIDKNCIRVDKAHNPDQPVLEIMRPFEEVATYTVEKGKVLNMEEAVKAVSDLRKGYAIPINPDRRFRGLCTRTDILTKHSWSKATTVDEDGRLRLGNTIGVDYEKHQGRMNDLEFAKRGWDEFGLDLVYSDLSVGNCYKGHELIRRMNIDYGEDRPRLVAGNFDNFRSIHELAKLTLRETEQVIGKVARYVDAVKIGRAPGHNCESALNVGIGEKQVKAIFNCAYAADQYGIILIADGGAGYSTGPGAFSKAITAGAHACMAGDWFSHCKESATPGEIWGMGWEGVMSEAKVAIADRYDPNMKQDFANKSLPEGFRRVVPIDSSVSQQVLHFRQALERSIAASGYRTLQEYRMDGILTYDPSGHVGHSRAMKG